MKKILLTILVLFVFNVTKVFSINANIIIDNFSACTVTIDMLDAGMNPISGLTGLSVTGGG